MRPLYVKRYLITGLLTIVPLWLTWVVFKFVFTLLSHVGAPVVAGMAVALSAAFPSASTWLSQEWLQSIIAFVFTVLFLYVSGWASNRMFGQRLLNGFEGMISRIPLVQPIYGGAKKLMTMLSTKPAGTQRVVLIDFPVAGTEKHRLRDASVRRCAGPRTRLRVCTDDAESHRRVSRDRAGGKTRRDRLEHGSGDGVHPFRRRGRARQTARRRASGSSSKTPAAGSMMKITCA